MPSSPKTEKLLIIEGDSAFGEKLADAFKKDGYSGTALAKDGNEGLKKIMDDIPHIVILDMATDGYDVLAKKNAEPVLSKIPVFFLSTAGSPIDMRRVPQGSVSEYIVTMDVNPADIVARVNAKLGHQPEPAAAPKYDKKVLWVEDDKLIGTILAKKLISSGFDLFHAKNGNEALEALKEVPPDVIVLDLLLPGMSGFDILAKVKADARLKDIPVMILSNLSKQSDIERAKTLGADKFLVKAAASLDDIVSEIRALCK